VKGVRGTREVQKVSFLLASTHRKYRQRRTYLCFRETENHPLKTSMYKGVATVDTRAEM